MILGKNWKYILADRLESDVDLRRAEGLVSEGCRFVGPHAFEGAAWSVVSENMAFAVVRGCPRDFWRSCLLSADVRAIHIW